MPYPELYHLETSDMEKWSAYGPGGAQFCFKYFRCSWVGLLARRILPSLTCMCATVCGLRKNQVSSLTRVQRTKSLLP